MIPYKGFIYSAPFFGLFVLFICLIINIINLLLSGTDPVRWIVTLSISLFTFNNPRCILSIIYNFVCNMLFISGNKQLNWIELNQLIINFFFLGACTKEFPFPLAVASEGQQNQTLSQGVVGDTGHWEVGELLGRLSDHLPPDGVQVLPLSAVSLHGLSAEVLHQEWSLPAVVVGEGLLHRRPEHIPEK